MKIHWHMQCKSLIELGSNSSFVSEIVEHSAIFNIILQAGRYVNIIGKFLLIVSTSFNERVSIESRNISAQMNKK